METHPCEQLAVFGNEPAISCSVCTTYHLIGEGDLEVPVHIVLVRSLLGQLHSEVLATLLLLTSSWPVVGAHLLQGRSCATASHCEGIDYVVA